MRNSWSSLLAAAATAFALSVGGPTSANAESVMKACASQWKQAQTTGATGGQSWPQFLARCRASQTSAASTPASAPATQSGSLFPWSQPSAPASAPNTAGSSGTQSVMRLCASQWKDAKAAGTTGGQSWPQFLAQCRKHQGSAAAPSGGIAPAAPAPAHAPASQSGSLFPWWQQSAPSSTPGAPATPRAGEYTTELAARARCPSDTVVWANTPS